MAQALLVDVLMQFLYLKTKISVGPMLNCISQHCGYLEFMIETIKKPSINCAEYHQRFSTS
jgi:hypothetical protein